MRREWIAVAVALPVLAIGLAIAKAELQGKRSREFVFQIGGFDPRDLLKGRYLQFRLRVNEGPDLSACDASVRDDCCVCLMSIGRDVPPTATRASCEAARAQCDGALPARYLQQPLRYYVPELEAGSLEQRMFEAMQHDAASARIAIDPSGALQVRELRLYGAPIGRAQR